MTAAKAPTPGDDEAVGVRGGARVGGQLDVGADPLEGAHGRPDVAEAVVEDDDAGLGAARGQATPSAPALGGRAAPARSARPTPRAAASPATATCPTLDTTPSTSRACDRPEQQVLEDRRARRTSTSAGGQVVAALAAGHRDGGDLPLAPLEQHRPGRSRSSCEIAAAPSAARPRVAQRPRCAPIGDGTTSTSTFAIAHAAASGAGAATCVITRTTDGSSPAVEQRGEVVGDLEVVGQARRPSQRALGRRDALDARVELDGGRSARASALNCASTMWCGSRPASTRTWMQIAGVVRDRLEHVPGQRAREVAADQVVLLARGLAGVHEVRAAGDVDDGLRERLVERHGGVAEPRDAALVAERLPQRLADRDRDVLDRVVRVDVRCRRSP